ncbi:permease, partial [Mycobacterium sp. E2497]|uniref:permease n=1 Tax=Mycobacterium sp. E2497 TaxID=1834135 RepID=UPI0018D287F6
VFAMEWLAILRDLVLGLLIAGAIAAWVPEKFWQVFFLVDHPGWSAIWGPLVGPIVAIVSFVCSIGNVPLAAVLWNGGISFGGVIAFIYADLLIVPILNIYRKYYGTKMMLTLLGTFYAAMVAAGYLVELIFGATNLIPNQRNATVMEATISWNYTTWLNIAFLVVAAILVVRFVTTGGIPMARMMGGSPDSPDEGHEHAHECH